jgi:molybdopterin-containing oxidoreductase family iron-sulfur binding subunit
MDNSKRTFLKVAGVSLLGIGSKPIQKALAGNAEPKILPSPDALTGKRWAMVVDMKKCKKDCRDCINACHQVHNVPDFGNPKDEVKWIWKEPYEKTFPGEENEYIEVY